MQGGGIAIPAVGAVLLRQKIHGEMNPLQIPTGHREITRFFSAGCNDDSIISRFQFGKGKRFTNVAGEAKLNSFSRKQINAALHLFLTQFVMGNAVHQQATGPISLLKNRDLMTGPVQLLSAGQAGGATADNRNPFATAICHWLRPNPTLFKAFVNNRNLMQLDRHRRRDNPQHTGCFTGGRADPTSEFGKIVGRMESLQGLFPLTTINQIVPLRNQIAERTAAHAEGYAAIHAARRLGFGLLVSRVIVMLIVMVQTIVNRLDGLVAAPMLDKSAGVTHGRPPLSCWLFLPFHSEPGGIRTEKPAQNEPSDHPTAPEFRLLAENLSVHNEQ